MSQLCWHRGDSWNSILCSGSTYVEVVIRGELRTSDIEVVRLSQSTYDLYWEYSFNEFSERLSEMDRARVDTFATILQQLEKQGMRLEGVN